MTPKSHVRSIFFLCSHVGPVFYLPLTHQRLLSSPLNIYTYPFSCYYCCYRPIHRPHATDADFSVPTGEPYYSSQLLLFVTPLCPFLRGPEPPLPLLFKAANGEPAAAAAAAAAEGSTAKDAPSNADLMADLDDDDEEEEGDALKVKESKGGAVAKSDGGEWTLSDNIDWSALIGV